MKKVLLLMLAVMISAAGFAKKYDLSLNLKKGETYSLYFNMDMNMKQIMPGMEMDIKVNMDFGTNMKVVSVDNDVFKFEVSYTELSMNMQTPQGEVNFSSNGPADNPASRIFKGLSKFHFTMYMDKHGKLGRVEGFDKLVDAMLAEFPEIPEAEKAQAKEQFESSFGEAKIKEMFTQATGYLPNKPVKKGESWETSFKKETNGVDMEFKNVYTFKGKKRGKYVIEVETVISTEEDLVKNINGIDFGFSVDGNVTGKTYLDKKSHWILSGSNDMSLNMTMEAAAQGVTIEMIMDGKTIMSEEPIKK